MNSGDLLASKFGEVVKVLRLESL